MSFPQGTTATLEGEYTDGIGAYVDPVDPLVTILDPDGVEVVTDAEPTRHSLGHYHYDHAIASNAALGTWIARWSGTIGGILQTGDDEFDVVAASTQEFYFTVAEGRAADATFAGMSDAAVASARTEVEDEIENSLCRGYAFVPRTAEVTLSGTGSTTLFLPHLYVRSVTAVRTWTTDPAVYVDLTEDELADIPTPSETGVLRRSTLGYWPAGWENVRVSYTYGMDAPPGNVKRAALILFRYRVAGATWRIPSDTLAVDAEGNPTAEGLSAGQTSGRSDVDSPSGIPLVDDLLRPWLGGVPVFA